jgi:hypothetical protein
MAGSLGRTAGDVPADGLRYLHLADTLHFPQKNENIFP